MMGDKRPRVYKPNGCSPDETLVTSSDLKLDGTILGHHAIYYPAVVSSTGFGSFAPEQSSPDMELDFISYTARAALSHY